MLHVSRLMGLLPGVGGGVTRWEQGKWGYRSNCGVGGTNGVLPDPCSNFFKTSITFCKVHQLFFFRSLVCFKTSSVEPDKYNQFHFR